MTRFTRTGRLAAAAAAVLAFATACGSSGSSSSYGASTTTPAPPSSAASTPQSSVPGSAPVALRVTTDATLGQIVTDGGGHTLYRFDQDTAHPSASHCAGACATNWPPAPAPSQITATGVDSGLIGTLTRADGTRQLTLNGWPLYRYAAEAAPGDTKGQGVGGTWFASTPTGGKAGTRASTGPGAPAVPSTASTASTPGSPSNGGYGY